MTTNGEEFDLEKLSTTEQQDLREWAKTKEITWEQIQSLNTFQKAVKTEKTQEEKKTNMVNNTRVKLKATTL